jgi:hypothetical protein
MSAGLQRGGGGMWVHCTHYKSGYTLYEFAVSKTNMLTSPLKKKEKKIGNYNHTDRNEEELTC